VAEKTNLPAPRRSSVDLMESVAGTASTSRTPLRYASSAYQTACGRRLAGGPSWRPIFFFLVRFLFFFYCWFFFFFFFWFFFFFCLWFFFFFFFLGGGFGCFFFFYLGFFFFFCIFFSFVFLFCFFFFFFVGFFFVLVLGVFLCLAA